MSCRKHRWDGRAAQAAFMQPHATTPASHDVGQGSRHGPAHTLQEERDVPRGHTIRLSQPGSWCEGFTDGRRDLRLHPSEGWAGLH